MAGSGKEFLTNFRNARLNPFASTSSPSLITRGDVVKRNRSKDYKEAVQKERAKEEADRAYVDAQVKETAPLRAAIREASGGRVIVDQSIYNKTSLERILNSVKAMQEQNDGALQPGYTIISDSKNDMWSDGKNLGSATSDGPTWMNRLLPGFQWNLPRDHYGTKNAPYRVYLRYPNDVEYNDYLARDALDTNWTIENFNDDNVESATHSHELAHTAYYDALKKIKNPLLAFGSDRKTIENFKNTHHSLQEMFDVAAKNTGFKNLKDAAASISEYALNDVEEDEEKGGLDASKNWGPKYLRLPEVFAEAYNDVLYNKQYASEYSKELIRLYAEYVNDYNKTFNDDKIVLKQPILTTDFGGENNFINNLRRSR